MDRKFKSLFLNIERLSFFNKNWKQIGIILCLIILISFLFTSGETLQYSYKLNDITREPIIAPFTFPILKTVDNYEIDKELSLIHI